MGRAVDPILPFVIRTKANRFRVSKFTFISEIKSMSHPSEGRRPKLGYVAAIVPMEVVAEEIKFRIGSPGRPHFERAFRPAWMELIAA
jgi:hypothetical protein